MKKNKLRFQKGLIKEIIVIIAVIFILAYFNIDPEFLWEKVVGAWNYLINLLSF